MAKRKRPNEIRNSGRSKPTIKKNDFYIHPQLLVGINAQPITMLPAPYNIQGARARRIRE